MQPESLNDSNESLALNDSNESFNVLSKKIYEDQNSTVHKWFKLFTAIPFLKEDQMIMGFNFIITQRPEATEEIVRFHSYKKLRNSQFE